MLVASALLAVLAFALAWPVPVLLSRAAWPSRAPGLALLVWQIVALAGGLSMIGSLLVFAFAPVGDRFLPAVWTVALALLDGDTGVLPGPVFVAAFCCAVLLTAHLLLSLLTTFVRAERERRRQHDLVVLLSSPDPLRPDTRLMAYPEPVAYCLPGAFRNTTVLTEGLVRMLDRDELDAVIAHERAHLDQAHHLLLLAFVSWRRALPWFPIATRASDAVSLLVEMLADDAAAEAVGSRPLASAIVVVGTGGGTVPASEIGAAELAPLAATSRVLRLASERRPLGAAARTAIVVVAAAVLLIPPALLLAA